MNACLARQLTDRLAALAPSGPGAAPPPPTAAASAPGVTPLAQPQAAAVTADPDIPSASNPPAAAGRLDVASLPAAGQAETLLHVTGPGRFAVAAHSQSGATLQLVDILSNASDIAGAAGSQDGRLDQLLGIGVYKLRVLPAKGATGSVALDVTAFHDAAPPAAPGAHAVLLCDGAGWHRTGGRLRMPDNITLLPLPSYSPQLNPVENVWAYLRGNFLNRRVWDNYDDHRRRLLQSLERIHQ